MYEDTNNHGNIMIRNSITASMSRHLLHPGNSAVNAFVMFQLTNSNDFKKLN